MNNKKSIKAFCALLTALFFVIMWGGTATSAVGKDYSSMPGVVQGDNGKTFAKEAPIVSILLDPAIIRNKNNAKLKFLAEETYPGFTTKTSAEVKEDRQKDKGDWAKEVSDFNDTLDGNMKFVVYDETQAKDGQKLEKNSMNTFSATNGIFSFTYKNAAMLPNGKTADLVLTYNNISIPLQSNLGESGDPNVDYSKLEGWQAVEGSGNKKGTRIPDDYFLIAVGDYIRTGNSMTRDSVKYAYNDKNEKVDRSSWQTTRNGLKMDVTIQVVDNNDSDNPQVVDGTFFFLIRDLDVNRTGSATFDNIYGSGKNKGNSTTNVANYNYSENIQINSGIYSYANNGTTVIPANVYIPDKNGVDDPLKDHATNASKSGYRCEIIKNGASYLFNAATTADADPGTCYTGFVTVADNSTGLNLTVYSSGLSDACVRTWLLDTEGDYFKNISTATGYGGNIQTTENGNPNKDLTDGSKVLDRDDYKITEGKTVTYTITPETDTTVDRIVIDDTTITDLPENAGEEKLVDPTDRSKGVIGRLPDGRYYVTFENIAKEHKLNAFYSAPYYFSKTWGKGTGNSLNLIARPYIFNGAHFFSANSLGVQDISFTVTKDNASTSGTDINGNTVWNFGRTLPTTTTDPKVTLYWFISEETPSGYIRKYDNSGVTYFGDSSWEHKTAWETAVHNMDTGMFASPDSSKSGTIINTKACKLTIKNTVKGDNADPEKYFDYELDLQYNGTPYELDVLPPGVTKLANGKYGFRLKHGESVEMIVPVGTTYNIVQLDSDYNESNGINGSNSGIIKGIASGTAANGNDMDEDIEITFVNEKPIDNAGEGSQNGNKEPKTENVIEEIKREIKSPRTGDPFMTGFWILSSALSMTGMLIVDKKRKAIK